MVVLLFSIEAVSAFGSSFARLDPLRSRRDAKRPCLRTGAVILAERPSLYDKYQPSYQQYNDERAADIAGDAGDAGAYEASAVPPPPPSNAWGRAAADAWTSGSLESTRDGEPDVAAGWAAQEAAGWWSQQEADAPQVAASAPRRSARMRAFLQQSKSLARAEELGLGYATARPI